jgi:hypothetical protein
MSDIRQKRPFFLAASLAVHFVILFGVSSVVLFRKPSSFDFVAPVFVTVEARAREPRREPPVDRFTRRARVSRSETAQDASDSNAPAIDDAFRAALEALSCAQRRARGEEADDCPQTPGVFDGEAPRISLQFQPIETPQQRRERRARDRCGLRAQDAIDPLRYQSATPEEECAKPVFERAKMRGELPKDLDADAALAMTSGALLYRVHLMARPIDEEWIARVVAMITHRAGADETAKASSGKIEGQSASARAGDYLLPSRGIR